MAATELYDFLTTISSDVNETLSLTAQGEIIETGDNNVRIHQGDDGSEERCVISSTPIFYVQFPYKALSQSDAGTIFTLYYTSSKANGTANSFKWTASDGHTYVVRFAAPVNRNWLMGGNNYAGYNSVTLRILGRIAD